MQFTLEASEIELVETKKTLNFVISEGDDKGKIDEKYRTELIGKTGVNGNIQYWEKFKSALKGSRQKKSIAGEVAAKFYFESKGYQILEDHYKKRIDLLQRTEANENMKTKADCTTKKGPDNGIDGLFIPEKETIEKHSEIIINEAKFRDDLTLSTSDFGFVAGGIQQSHSSWNKTRFGWVGCLNDLDYDKETIIRRATLLNTNGLLKVYTVKDKK